MAGNRTRNNRDSAFISFCICTYLRPEMLAKALEAVISQDTPSFSFEVVVVDNDRNRSAEETVHRIQSRTQIAVSYTCEPEQNISLARNRAVRSAGGSYIAFIDDDEFPIRDWLARMYNCLLEYEADSVLGPVLPDYPDGVPHWLIKSGFCNRRRNATGSPISEKDRRSGNILFRRDIFEKDALWFDPARGLTGGEDSDFIDRQIQRGKKFIWCDEAVVYETVAPARWSASYYLQRSFRSGALSGKAQHRQVILGNVARAAVLFAFSTVILPFSFPAGKHVWMKVLMRSVYYGGFLLSFAGFLNPSTR